MYRKPLFIYNGEYPIGMLVTRETVILASLYTSHDCGLILEDGLTGDMYHKNVTGEFLNKGDRLYNYS